MSDSREYIAIKGDQVAELMVENGILRDALKEIVRLTDCHHSKWPHHNRYLTIARTALFDTKDVDADDPEVKRLVDAGWNHCGNDMWINPCSTMHNPVRRDTALRFEEILS